MTTQLQAAGQGIITEQMRAVAIDERLDPEIVRSEIAAGRLIIPANINHKNLKPIGIGMACRCKINANIGNSALSSDLGGELCKLSAALEAGSDAVMDLSTGANIDTIRRGIIERCPAPLGTVPLYEAAEMVEKIEDLTADQLFDVIERHAKQGVDFITVHCGLLSAHVDLALRRTAGIVSRGGALTARWMRSNKRKIRFTSTTIACWISAKNMTSPCRSAMGSAPAALRTPLMPRNSRNSPHSAS